MDCDPNTGKSDKKRDVDPFCSDFSLAQQAPFCILISANREVAWGAARKIAHGCGSGLSWIDCDTVEPEDMADLLRDHALLQSAAAVDRILLLREVQGLSRENQAVLNELIASQRPAPNRPRLIASSSLSLYECVQAGLFDEALFYKLNAVHITL
jgi:Sigma-54 interaction domain